jgi:N-acetyl-gamma-glutamyl-phosphate reductase
MRPAAGVRIEALREALAAFGAREPFVRACPAVEAVRTAHVRATNYCDVGVALLERSATVVVVTAIDNTVKGAGGQAVQNMNIAFGLDETKGLDRPSL